MRENQHTKSRRAFGSDDDAPDRVRLVGPLTQDEIAAIQGCTRGNVHMIEKRALKKLKAAVVRDPELAEVFHFIGSNQ